LKQGSADAVRLFGSNKTAARGFDAVHLVNDQYVDAIEAALVTAERSILPSRIAEISYRKGSSGSPGGTPFERAIDAVTARHAFRPESVFYTHLGSGSNRVTNGERFGATGWDSWKRAAPSLLMVSETCNALPSPASPGAAPCPCFPS